MDRMRIAEQRKEVYRHCSAFVSRHRSVFVSRHRSVFVSSHCSAFVSSHCSAIFLSKAIVRLMEEGFGERVWSFRAVKA